MHLHAPSVRVVAAAFLSLSVAAACGDDGSDGSSGGNGGGLSSDGGDSSSGGDPQSGGSSSNGGSTSSAPGDGCIATFDGVDDVLIADVGADLSEGDGFSIGASIRPGDVSGPRFVAGRHLDGSSNGFYLAIADEGQLEARLIVFVDNSTCAVAAPLTLPNNGFVHLLGSYSAPTARIFINGQPAGELTCPDSPTNIEPDSVFTIGRSQTGVFPFDGDIDRVEYLPTAFTAAFDPASIDCGSADAIYEFDGVAAGESSAVADSCGKTVNAQVGSAKGADASDPTFACAR